MARRKNLDVTVKAKHSYREKTSEDDTDAILVSTNRTIAKRDDFIDESINHLNTIGKIKKTVLIEKPFRDYFFFLTKQHFETFFKSASGNALPLPETQQELEAFYFEYKHKLVVRRFLITTLPTFLDSNYDLGKCVCTIEFMNEDANDDPVIANNATPEDLNHLPLFFELKCPQVDDLPTQHDILSAVKLPKRKGRPRNSMTTTDAKEERDTSASDGNNSATPSKTMKPPKKAGKAFSKQNKKTKHNASSSEDEKAITSPKKRTTAKKAATAKDDEKNSSSPESQKTKSPATSPAKTDKRDQNDKVAKRNASNKNDKKEKDKKRTQLGVAPETRHAKRLKMTTEDDSLSSPKAEHCSKKNAPENATSDTKVTKDDNGYTKEDLIKTICTKHSVDMEKLQEALWNVEEANDTNARHAANWMATLKQVTGDTKDTKELLQFASELNRNNLILKCYDN